MALKQSKPRNVRRLVLAATNTGSTSYRDGKRKNIVKNRAYTCRFRLYQFLLAYEEQENLAVGNTSSSASHKSRESNHTTLSWQLHSNGPHIRSLAGTDSLQITAM